MRNGVWEGKGLLIARWQDGRWGSLQSSEEEMRRVIIKHQRVPKRGRSATLNGGITLDAR